MPFYKYELIDSFRQRFKNLYGDSAQMCLKRLRMMIGCYGVGNTERRHNGLWDETTSVLITYGDMVTNDGEVPLDALKAFADNRLQGALSAIHVLPFFPYSSDDGFSVIDYRKVNPDLGSWKNIEALGENFELMFDLVLNHVSSKSAWFRDFTAGIMPAKNYFITAELDEDLSAVVRPRTSPLLSEVATRYETQYVWTTFSADQVDLDFSNPDVFFEFLEILFYYISKGARIIRLDAIAYLWKEKGTSCIHLEQTHEVVRLYREILEMVAPDVIILTETNVPHEENISYFGIGDEAHMVYQFSLPPLVLHALLNGYAGHLTNWAASLGDIPHGCTYLNFTASHDGVGVRPLEGILSKDEISDLCQTVKDRGGHVSCKKNSDGSESPYELNISYFDALCEEAVPSDVDIERFLCSQTIPMVLAGVPAVYFHSLCATRNYSEGVEKLGYPRAINRRKWLMHDLELLLNEPSTTSAKVFNEYIRRLRLRSGKKAFHPDGEQEIIDLGDSFFCVKRVSIDKQEEILAICNVMQDKKKIPLDEMKGVLGEDVPVELFDLLADDVVDTSFMPFLPYQVRWLVLKG